MSNRILRSIINKFPSDFTFAVALALALSPAAADYNAFCARYDSDESLREKLRSSCIYHKKSPYERIYRVFPELKAVLKPELRNAEMLFIYWEDDWKAFSISERQVRRCLELAESGEEMITRLKTKQSIYARLEEMMQEANV